MKEIIIVGLGPGGLGQLSFGAWQALAAGGKIYLRTERHPVVRELEEKGIRFTTFDHLYEEKGSFEEVYAEIVRELLAITSEDAGGRLVYGVPGHPLVGEETVRRLQQEGPPSGVKITIIPSMSFIETLYGAAGLDPTAGYTVHDALSVTAQEIDTRQALIFFQVYNRTVASDLKLLLLELYPHDHPVTVVKGAGLPREEKIAKVELCELDHLDWFDHLTSVYVEPSQDKDGRPPARYPLDPLVEVMDKLLSPQGCPWDKEQDHLSLKPYVLEEAYEVVEAIDSKDMHKLTDELGDLLLQIVFHSALAQRNGDFDVNDVIATVIAKMVRRHPHVFADTVVQDADEVMVNWEKIKAKERADGQQQKVRDDRMMSRLNRRLPALMLAEDVQKKARKVGFDWPDSEGAWEKVFEEIDELKEACLNGDKENMENELGDLLFAVVNVARFVKSSPETALRKTVGKFVARFNYIEQKIEKNGKKWGEMGLADLDELWEKAKKSGL